MSNYLNTLELLSTAVDQLNEILQGDENTTVLINGESKPSVQKKTLDEVTAKVQLILDAAADIDAVKYGTVSAGLSSSSNEGYFSVVSDNDSNYLDLYKNDNGAALYIKSYPSTILVSDLAIKSKEFLKNQGQLRIKNFNLIGNVENGSAAPSTPAEGDSYFVNESGTIFGLFVRAGQFIAFENAKWRVVDLAETLSYLGASDYSLAVKSDYSFQVLINLNGTLTPSGVYSATSFIPTKKGDVISLETLAYKASAAISFYDEDFNFIYSIAGTQNGEFNEIVKIESATIKYLRFCSVNDEALNPKPNAVVLSTESSVLTESDFTISETSNLAKEENILLDTFIASDNDIEENASGWKCLKLLTPANTEYTFGNYTATGPIYGAFYDVSGTLIESIAPFESEDLPISVTGPDEECFFYLNIARPQDDPSEIEQLQVNLGGSLLPYESPEGKIEEIKGYSIAGNAVSESSGNAAVLGENANFDVLSANEISTSTLVLNLPSGTTEPTGLSLNHAWIDENDGTMKVKLS